MTYEIYAFNPRRYPDDFLHKKNTPYTWHTQARLGFFLAMSIFPRYSSSSLYCCGECELASNLWNVPGLYLRSGLKGTFEKTPFRGLFYGLYPIAEEEVFLWGSCGEIKNKSRYGGGDEF